MSKGSKPPSISKVIRLEALIAEKTEALNTIQAVLDLFNDSANRSELENDIEESTLLHEKITHDIRLMETDLSKLKTARVSEVLRPYGQLGNQVKIGRPLDFSPEYIRNLATILMQHYKDRPRGWKSKFKDELALVVEHATGKLPSRRALEKILRDHPGY
jgi:hypothetical protein